MTARDGEDGDDGNDREAIATVTATSDAVSPREILVRLLDLTPEPPSGLEADQLIAAFEEIVVARDGVIAAVAEIALPVSLTDDVRALFVELKRREALWQDALTAARQRIGQQRCGAEKLRAYAPTP
jgi:hypothetical protein